MSDHVASMRVAIEEARRALGPCHPNPAVGAVVIHRGSIAATGFTQPPGGAHAEVQAIEQFLRRGLRADESTALCVTLEPCSTVGRTPPCTDFILKNGIRRVVVGATDPNPAHSGNGFRQLLAAGVTLETGVLAAECEALNPVFNHWMHTGGPLIAGKIATTLDGRIATRSGHSQWITGERAREDVACWRRAFPGIAVGGGTVLRDDPRLTSRPTQALEWCPRRLIFDRAGLCLDAPEKRVFSGAFADRTIYLTRPDRVERVPWAWRERGVAVWAFNDWGELRERLLGEGITGLYVEGGPRLLSDLLRARELDYLFAYRAPLWLGDAEAPGAFHGFSPATLSAAFRLRDPQSSALGPDQLLHGPITYPADFDA